MNVVNWTSVCVTGKDYHLFKSQETFQEKVTSEIFLQGKSELVVQNRGEVYIPYILPAPWEQS